MQIKINRLNLHVWIHFLFFVEPIFTFRYAVCDEFTYLIKLLSNKISVDHVRNPQQAWDGTDWRVSLN